MVIELSAVRLLAPWFGSSLVVWTNVIAVILLALAVGYLLGGALASRASPLGTLSRVLLGAGAFVAWLPYLAGILARALLPPKVALHEAAELIGWGSLTVSLVVFLPPAILLGTVCPLVVETLARARNFSAGKSGGTVLFVSTLGSLLGVYGTSHFLLPLLGLQQTFWVASGMLMVAGGLAGFPRPRPANAKAFTSIALLICASSLLVPRLSPLAFDGRVEIARRESTYQSLRVVEDRSGSSVLRYLQVNEGFDSFQSVWQEEPGLLPEGFYYNDFLLPLSWSERTGPWRVLVLGLGAGTVVRVLAGEPGLVTRIVGVELDPGIVELGQAYFGLDEHREELTTWSGMDARVALRGELGPFDQIVLDCYSNQVEIPAHLCTREFFDEVRERLCSGGWLTANLGGFDFSDPVVESVAATCASAFAAPVLIVRVPLSRNYLLMARRDAPLPWADGTLQAATRRSSLHLGPRRLPSFSRLVMPVSSTAPLTDDWCPIEKLQLRSIAEARARRLSAGES